jgi:hypothetical protein
MFDWIYDRIMNNQIRKYDSVCQICKSNIRLNPQDNIYYFKIIGLGKYDNKILCQECLINKFTNTKK